MIIISPISMRIPGQKKSKSHRIPRPMMKTAKDMAPHKPPPDPFGPKQASLSSAYLALGLTLSFTPTGAPHLGQNSASSFNSAPHFVQKGNHTPPSSAFIV